MNSIVLAEQKNKLQVALSEYASALGNLTDEEVPMALDMTAQLADLAEEVRLRLRDRLLASVRKNGSQVTDKGSMAHSTGGYKVTAIPTRTGVDPKKLEAKLRAMGEDPTKLMRSTVTYSVDQEKIVVATATNLLGIKDWLASVQYDKAYRVQVERELG